MQIVSDVKTAQRAVTPDEGDTDLEGYYCLRTKPHNCACRERPWEFVHYQKKIVVWSEKDHPGILNVANAYQKLGIDPKIVEYKTMMGKAIDYDDISNGESLG